MVTCESQRATAVAEKFFSQFKLLAPLFQIFWQFSSSNTLDHDTVTIFISFYELLTVDKISCYFLLNLRLKFTKNQQTLICSLPINPIETPF